MDQILQLMDPMPPGFQRAQQIGHKGEQGQVFGGQIIQRKVQIEIDDAIGWQVVPENGNMGKSFRFQR